jgi:hypothetical protein
VEILVAADVSVQEDRPSSEQAPNACGKADEDEFHRAAQEQKPRPRLLLAEAKRWTI